MIALQVSEWGSGYNPGEYSRTDLALTQVSEDTGYDFLSL